MLLAWIELHKDEYMADWELAVFGEQPIKLILCGEYKESSCKQDT